MGKFCWNIKLFNGFLKMAEKKLKSETKKAMSIQLDIALLQQIDKRAKKNYLTLREQIEDILRRSMLSYGKVKSPSYKDPNVSKFMKIFSREKPGRKPKR